MADAVGDLLLVDHLIQGLLFKRLAAFAVSGVVKVGLTQRATDAHFRTCDITAVQSVSIRSPCSLNSLPCFFSEQSG